MRISFVLSLALLANLSAQTASITNVTAAQRTDGSKQVDIYYDLAPDTLFNLYEVRVEVSLDGGLTFTPIQYITGDAGIGISAGTAKHIVWDLGREFGGVYSDQTQIKVIATGHFIQVNFPFVFVPAGPFNYSVTGQSVTIAGDFEIMQYEVTNAEYVEYLLNEINTGHIYLNGDQVRGFFPGNATLDPGDYAFLNLSSSRISWNGTTFIVEEGYGNHPVTGITWVGATSFANYYGLRLPTSEEWEKTARGINDWSYWNGLGMADSNATNFLNSGDPFDNGTTPVGFYDGTLHGTYQTQDAPSDYGAYDMDGNVAEWTSTPSSRNDRSFIRRGGCWQWENWDARYTRWDEPWFEEQNPTNGFRCVRDISTARAQWLKEKLRRRRPQ